MATVPALFMYPQTARALLDLSVCKREIRLARRIGAEALADGDFDHVRRAAENARAYRLIEGVIITGLREGLYAQF